jgi:hypothetical protein
VSDSVRGNAGCWGAALLFAGVKRCYVTTHRFGHQAFRVACSEPLQWTDADRMGSSKSTFATKYCSSLAFLAGIMSLAVDYTWILCRLQRLK